MPVVTVSPTTRLTDNDWEYLLSMQPGDFVQKVIDSLKNSNRFFVDERLCKLLFEYANDERWKDQSHLQINVGHTFFRARVYKENQKELIARVENPEAYGVFQGYDAKGSFVPEESKAGENRGNPSGIVYLYCSSDIETSLLEVRSQPGEHVSVATICVEEPILLFDISKPYTGLFDSENERERWICYFYLVLMSTFQRPYSKTGNYYFTQYVSEYLKNLGFDGIAFRSSFERNRMDASGINFTVFNYSKCKAISSKLYHVLSMSVLTDPKLTDKGESL